MRLIRWNFVLILLSLISFVAQAKSPSIAFYYGSNPPVDLLHAFNIAVVDPEQQVLDPKTFETQNSQAFAYVNVGEVDRDKTYFNQLNSSWIIGQNAAWRSVVMDNRNPAWRAFLLNQVITPLWNQGYKGFFLDTLDSYQLVVKDPSQRAAQVAGLVSLIQSIKAKYPSAQIILNRGFELLPQVHNLITAVAAESVFQGWDQAQQRYTTVTPSDRAWVVDQLKKVQAEGLTAIAIDYAAPNERSKARDIAAKIKALGFVPWVTNGALNEMGVGQIEVVPRTILMLYQYPNIYVTAAALFASLPLNYLGYRIDYVNIDDPLPEDILVGRYAGIVVWPIQNDSAHRDTFYAWVEQQIHDGVPIAFMDYLGFPATKKYLSPLGLGVGPEVQGLATMKITVQSPIMGYEIAPYPEPLDELPLKLTQGNVLLQTRDQQGLISDAVGITPWGGYALYPYVIRDLPKDQELWVLNPFEFFMKALRLKPIPAPDTTTENGRRLMMVHVDGDGFISRSEFDMQFIAGQMMYQRIFQRYHVPSTVSVIVGEIAPYGVAPKLSPIAMQAARDIFALPWVEIGSHTFSHPFEWGKLENPTSKVLTDSRFKAGAPGEQYYLTIPNYHFSIQEEVTGSIDFINRYLAPPNKFCKVILWSGDSQISNAVLGLAYQDGVANMNGGNTTISVEQPSLTNVAPLGVPRGPYFQLFSPNQNDNVYTNLWQGPFYGYSNVIQTFKLTESPHRLKPIDIYYHFFSATKLASLSALETVYDWALSQNVMNIYVSDYFKKVLDFNQMTLARDGDAWLIEGRGDLRELRVPQSMGVPDLSRGQNIVGYNEHENDYYIHLGPALETRLYFTSVPPKAGTDLFNDLLGIPCRPRLRVIDGDWIDLCASPGSPFIQDANARVTAFERRANGFTVSFAGYMSLDFTLANMSRCELFENGKPIIGDYAGPGIDEFQLNEVSGTFEVKCR